MDTISIKTDYEVLKSLIKIKDLITYAKANNINSLGVIDNNLSSSIEFYEECKKNNLDGTEKFSTVHLLIIRLESVIFCCK